LVWKGHWAAVQSKTGGGRHRTRLQKNACVDTVRRLWGRGGV
jgi:hypothetical protein